MFKKIKAVLLSAAKTVAKTAISVKNKATQFAKVSGKTTARFFKVNIVETFHLLVTAAKCTKNFFSKGLAVGGLKQAFGSVIRKAGELKHNNPVSFKKLVAITSSIGVVICCLLSVVFFNLNTMAVSVITNGQIVGYVTDSSELDDIMSSVSEKLVDVNDKEKIDAVKFGIAIVPKSCVKNGEELAVSVLTAQDDFSAKVGLFVNGELVTCASSEQTINEALEHRKARYTTLDTKTVSILEEIEMKTVYCSSDNIVSDKKAVEFIENEVKLPLSIQTERFSTTVKTLAHETILKQDSSKVIGYNRVSVSGKDGSCEVSEMITSINGKVIETVVVDEKLIEPAINQIIVTGTSTNGMTTVQKTLASKGISFLWPIESTSGMYISSAWGSGRNHTGIDITGDYGTPIYASCEGTVSYAGWAGEYGYLIVINHKGGYQTAYAHMSSIYVKAGQTVNTGDVIAGCGSTGIATGDHLHFEVRIGGTKVNPAPYLGLGY